MTTISPYRLGDLIFISLDPQTINDILTQYPNSIASKFILEKRKQPKTNNVDLVTSIVVEHMKLNEVASQIPSDIQSSTVIHLRLGDVVAGTEWHEKVKRPLEVSTLKSLVANNKDKRYVIGRCFFAKTSSKNQEECIAASNAYLQKVITELDATHFDSNSADVDLCCGVQSKLFIQGKGYFSNLIVAIRNKLGKPSITTKVTD